MAVNTATMTTFEQVGIREQLSDRIYDITPMETPVFTALRKGDAMTNRTMDWQTDAIRTPNTDNAALEGDDATYKTRTPTVRLKNHAQIFEEAVIVTDIANIVSTAGRKKEMAYQVMKAGKAVKLDIESVLSANFASRTGSRATAGRLGSIEAWLTTNVSRGSGGASGGYTASGVVTAATDASAGARRTLTEALFKTVLRTAWTAGGDPSLVIVGPVNKQRISAFAGIAEKVQEVATGAVRDSANVAILGGADIYVSDFGRHRIVASRYSRERSLLALDMEYWSIHYLQPFKVQDLARTGTAERKQLWTALSLCSKNQAANGIVADLVA